MILLYLGVLVLVSQTFGYNQDVAIAKWSPNYFNYRYSPNFRSYSKGGYGRGLAIEQTRGYNPSWYFGDASTMYKRRGGMDRGGCVNTGGVCLYRGGIMGAAVKLNCCSGTRCIFVGKSFTCVSDRDIKIAKGESSDTEEADEVADKEYF